MNIEIPDEITTSELNKLLGWLQDNGFKPLVKGKGNGEVFIKAGDPSLKEEENKELVELQKKREEAKKQTEAKEKGEETEDGDKDN